MSGLACTQVELTLPDGLKVRFSPFQFSGAAALAEIPSGSEPAQMAEAARKVAAVVAEVIPDLKDRSESYRAGIGFEISNWLEERGKVAGQ